MDADGRWLGVYAAMIALALCGMLVIAGWEWRGISDRNALHESPVALKYCSKVEGAFELSYELRGKMVFKDISEAAARELISEMDLAELVEWCDDAVWVTNCRKIQELKHIREAGL